jgi:hypothetical protein
MSANKIVETEFAKLMAPHNFRKQKLTWFRQANGVTLIIQLYRAWSSIRYFVGSSELNKPVPVHLCQVQASLEGLAMDRPTPKAIGHCENWKTASWRRGFIVDPVRDFVRDVFNRDTAPPSDLHAEILRDLFDDYILPFIEADLSESGIIKLYQCGYLQEGDCMWGDGLVLRLIHRDAK